MARDGSFLLFAAIAAATILSASGKLDCEELPVDLCAYAVSSTGHRCVLEKNVLQNGDIEYECQTSAVTGDQFAEWVETEDCVKSCGIQRMSVGMSSDPLVEKEFSKTLCSDDCQESCPNVFDLFSKLAAGEGVSLTQVCTALRSQSRRMMADFSVLASQSHDTFNTAAAPLASRSAFVLAPAQAPSEA